MEATFRAHVFFHCAVLYDRPNISNQALVEANVDLPLRVVSALLARGDDSRCVFADTFFRKFPARCSVQPRYTASKLQFRDAIVELHSRSPFPAVILLIEHMYGAGDDLRKALPSIAQRLVRKEPRIALTSGRQRRDFIHVDDVVSAMLTASSTKEHFLSEVGCGVGESYSWASAVALLRELCNSDSELGFGDLPDKPLEIMNSTADTRWLTANGWEPRRAIRDGFKELVSWIERGIEPNA